MSCPINISRECESHKTVCFPINDHLGHPTVNIRAGGQSNNAKYIMPKSVLSDCRVSTGMVTMLGGHCLSNGDASRVKI